MVYVKRIIKALIFTAGLIFLLVVASQIFVPKNNTEEDGMDYFVANGFQGEKENSVDVLFIGDSEFYSSIVPLQMWNDAGYTGYNCGTGGQPLSYSLALLQRSLNKQSPKVLFLETNAIYRDQSLAKVAYTMAGECLPILRYHDRWKILKGKDFTETPDYNWSDNDKGYRFYTEVKPPENINHMVPSDESESICRANRICVSAIKDLCDKNGIKLILVSIPSTSNWNYPRHNGVAKLAEELDCEFLDLNLLPEECPIDWNADTRDRGDHLNYAGAQKVTAYLTSYLTEHHLVESHKGDPYYANWDECYDKFMTDTVGAGKEAPQDMVETVD